jgi:alginate export protein
MHSNILSPALVSVLLYCGMSPGKAETASGSLEPKIVEPLKYIPLDDYGGWYASLSGELRDRFEYFNHYQFGGTYAYNLIRALADVDVHLGPNFHVFVQGISATKQGAAGGSLSSYFDELDLHQGFAAIQIPLYAQSSFEVLAGRQNMAYGAQRLIGVSDWSNVRRTFDGALGRYMIPGNTLDIFYMQPVQPIPYQFDVDVPGTQFAGIYDTWEVGDFLKIRTQLELYGLYVHRPQITFNETTASENRYTLGARLTAYPDPVDLDIEADYQAGVFNGATTNSFSVAATGRYTLKGAPFAPRLVLGFDIASGSRGNGNGDTFDQLFPSGHGKFGVIDVIGRQNIIDAHPGLSLTLFKKARLADDVSFSIDYRQFWRQSNRDGLYNSSGSVVRAANGSNAYSVGSELDLELDWQMDSHTGAYVGYAHFFAGQFIKETGPDNDIDFFYAAITFTF